MLSSAVERANKAAPLQRSSLAKQLFPSSSPVSIEDAFKAASHSSQSSTQHSERKGPITSNTLKPSAQSVLNGAGTMRHDGVLSNGLKRTASQCIPNNKDCFEERPSALVSSVASTYNNSFSKLHEGVYFDENDFDDDEDLDFSSPPSRPIIPKPVPKPILPATGEGKATVPDSSVPFPWSSSPLEHQLPRKRRTLPWLIADAAEKMEENTQVPMSRGAAAAGHKPKRVKSDSHDSSNAQVTTHPRNSANSNPHPWNKTASDIKEEQRRLRQTGKRLVKTNEATEEDKMKAVENKKKNTVLKVFLSSEQKRVEQLVVEKGKSVFFTGSAGTGKSVLLRSIITSLRAKFNKDLDRVAVTASTGLAACNVGGVTLHSFSGIGLGRESVPDLVRKIRRNPKAKTRWLRTKVLIIDEISMVDADLFDKLEGIARTMRNNGRPFGGIQLVITGDYFQLPPVPDNGRIAKFAFEAATWSTCLEHTIGLTQVFRQKDPAFAQMLNEMRLGKLSQASIDAFRKLSRPIHYTDGLEATELFPTRYEVENANNVRMRNLSGQSVIFDALDGGTMKDKAQRDKLLSSCMAPISIELKRGSQVMLIKNMDDSLVNGLLGKVIGFMDEKTFDIHHEDLSSEDESMDQSKKKLRAMLNMNAPGDTGKKWPLVRFTISDGTSRDLLCSPETWKIELPNGEVQASRSQIPLILAWALSIHKAQGQTLERVKVDLGKVFEKGQAYVALSRATCQEGLQVLRFDPAKVMAHEKVRSFYNKLCSVLELEKKVHVFDEDDYFDDEDELRAMVA